MHRHVRCVLVALLVAGLFPAVASAETTEPSTLRVHARATASAPPDQVAIAFSVITEAKRADLAAAQNAKKQAAVLNALKAVLGSDGSVETLGYGLTPKYVYPKNGVREIVGYTASNTVHVESRKLATVGELIDAGIGAGANQVERLQFGLVEPAALRREALTRAAREARDKASGVADALGLKILRILHVEEDGATRVSPPSPERFMARTAEAAVTTPVEAADVELGGGVTLTVEVAPK